MEVYLPLLSKDNHIRYSRENAVNKPFTALRFVLIGLDEKTGIVMGCRKKYLTKVTLIGYVRGEGKSWAGK